MLRIAKMSFVNAADRLDASSVHMVLGNPNVQQYSTSLLLIVRANISRRGLNLQNLLSQPKVGKT